MHVTWITWTEFSSKPPYSGTFAVQHVFRVYRFYSPFFYLELYLLLVPTCAVEPFTVSRDAVGGETIQAISLFLTSTLCKRNFVLYHNKQSSGQTFLETCFNCKFSRGHVIPPPPAGKGVVLLKF